MAPRRYPRAYFRTGGAHKAANHEYNDAAEITGNHDDQSQNHTDQQSAQGSNHRSDLIVIQGKAHVDLRLSK
jgi:hypothetical protein